MAKMPPKLCAVAVAVEMTPQRIIAADKYEAGLPILLRKIFDGTISCEKLFR
jgi:hypothetical protein